MTKAAIEGLALIFLLLLAGVLGYGFRGERNQAEITTAQANFATCSSASTAKDAALGVLQGKFKDLSDRHDQALAAATAALDGRDKTIATLQAGAAARAHSVRKTPHEDADCASLDRLPLCAALAGQLWPVKEQAAAGRNAH